MEKKAREELMCYNKAGLKNVLCALFAFILLILSVPAQSEVHHDQDIHQDTVWNATQVHVVGSDIIVSDGSTLFLEQGTIVKCEHDVDFNIQGTLKANGTAENKVYFTSLRDDSVGGDTNGDGNATSPSRGDWGQVKFYSGSNGNLQHAVLSYGGHRLGEIAYEIPILEIESSSIHVRDCLIENNFIGIAVKESEDITDESQESGIKDCISLIDNIIRNNKPRFNRYNRHNGISIEFCANSTITDNTIRNNSGNGGLFLKSCDNSSVSNNSILNNKGKAGLYMDSCSNCTIANNTLKKNSEIGVYLKSCTGKAYDNLIVENQNGLQLKSSAVEVSGNRIEDNSDYGLQLDISSSDSSIKADNIIQGNGHQNNIALNGGTLSSTATWDVFFTETDLNITVIGDIHIAANGRLTMAPGSVVNFASQKSLTVDGNFQANGTSVNPIYFTSIKDDSIEGDTNGDGSSTSPSSGDWGQIKFDSGSNATLKHAVLRYGGNNNNSVSEVENSSVQFLDCRIEQNSKGIKARNSDITIHDSDILDNENNGVSIVNSNIDIQRNEIANNDEHGAYLKSSFNATIVNNIILNNSKTGVYFRSSTGSLNENEIKQNKFGLTLKPNTIDMSGNEITDNSNKNIKTSEIIYKELFHNNPNYVALSPEYAYWDNNNGNYFVNTFDNLKHKYWAYSHKLGPVDYCNGTYIISLDILFENQDWGTYPRIRFGQVKQKSISTPSSLTIANIYSDDHYKQIKISGYEGKSFYSPSISDDTWYRVYIKYNHFGESNIKITNLARNKTILNVENEQFKLNDCTYLGLGYYNQPNYGSEWSPIRVDNIAIKNFDPPDKPQIIGGNLPSGQIAPKPKQNQASSFQITLEGTRKEEVAVRINGDRRTEFATGNWTTEVSLSEGNNTLEVRQEDQAGNLGPAAFVDILVDSVDPQVTSFTPSDGAILNTPPQSVRTGFQEDGSGLDLAASNLELVDGSNQEVPGSWRISGGDLVFTPEDPLPESVYTLNIRLRDELGNAMAQQSTRFFVDTTPPPAPEPDPATSPTHQATQLISGSKAVDASVELNGTQIVGHTEQTSWSHEVSLSPGENELVLTSRDRAGNLSPKAILRIVFDDIAPPEVACLSVNGELDGATAKLDWSGFDESQHGDIAKYQVFVSENEFSQVQGMSPTAELSLGTRTYTASGLSRGETYYFAVVAVDQTGNMRNEVSPFSAAISDASPPNRVRNFQADSGRTSLSFTWDPPSGEEPEEYHLYWDGSASPESLPANRTSWEQTGLDPASGYTCSIAAVDEAGNEGQKREITAATWLDNPDGISAEGYDGYAELSWSGVQAGNLLRHYAVYASRSPFDTVQGMSPETTSSGPSAKVAGLENNATYHFAVTAVNISGGRSPQVSPIAATPEQDREGPKISGLEYAGTALDQAQPLSESGAFRVTAEDPSGVSRVAFAVDGNDLVSAHSRPYRAELDLSEISDGEHFLEIEAVDSLGNTATRSYTFQVALAPPDAPQITSPSSGAVTNQPELSLEGTSEPGCEIRAYTNGTLAGNATVSEQGTFALRIGLSQGTNRLTARAVNRGGTSDPSHAVEVTLNTAVPSPPRGLSATPQKQGEVGLSWQRPPDTERIAGYLVYRSDSEFSDPAQAEKVTADPIQEASYTDMPPEDGSYYYRVVCLNKAGTPSDPSDSALAQSDGTPPRALAVEYEPQGEQDPDTGAVAPGRVEVTLRLSEPVAARPFLSLTPEGGTPISVDLSSQGERTYSGSFQVTNSTPSGPAWATFSARDEAGNRGTNIEAGKKLLLNTDGPALARIALDPSAPIENSQSDPRTVTVVLGLDEAVAPDATPWLAYRLSGSPGDPTRITGLERIGSQGADAQTWRAELTLPAEAGLDSAQTLSFAYDARDDLGNVCSRIEADNAYQVYQGDLPPLRAPEGFSGTPRPGGRIELSWEAVPDCAGYRVYRQAPNQGQMTPLSYLIPSDQTQYTDQTQSDAEYTYAVVSVRQENGQESESGLSRKITLTSDSLAPGAPTDLTLDLVGNGVRAAWSAPNATGELTYTLYRADASSIDSVSGLDPLIAGIPHRDSPRVVDTDPSAAQHCYAVTAVDEAGNESPPSGSAYLNQDLMPVSSLRVEQKGGQAPVLSWEHPGGDIAGFNVYLGDDSNSTQLTQSLLQQKSFIDSGYSGDRRTYSVVAVDETGRGSPMRGITLPRVEAELSSGAPLRRNLMNRLVYRVSNPTRHQLDNVRLLVEAGGRSHRSETFDLASGSSREMLVTVGGYKQLNATAELTETVEIRPAPGRVVRLQDSRSVQVAPGSLSLSVSTGRFLQGGNGTARLELANPGGGPVEVVTSSGTGSQRGIRFLLQDGEGNVLDVARLGQKLGDRIVNLPCGDSVARIPAEGSYTSKQVTLSVPASLSGDDPRVQARIPHVYHHRGKGDQVVMQGLEADSRVSLSRTSYSGKVTQVSPKQSSGNQSITIRGRAKDRSSGQGLRGAELILSISNQGYERERSVRTNSTGGFSHEFTPLEGESGLYKVCAVHPDLTARPVQERFVISRVSYNPAQVDLSLPRNQEKAFSVRVETGQGTEVDNLGLKYLPQDQPDGSLPEGVHVEPGDPVDLSGGSSARLPLTIWADNAAAEETSLVLRLASDNATWGTIPVQASFSQALPVLDFEPSHIETGVTHNATATERITLQNSGLAPLKDLELSLLQTDGSEAPSWARLSGISSRQEIPVGGSQSVGVAFSPDSDVDQGRHHFLLRVSGSNLDPVDIHCYATVARSGQGDAIFKVTDMYTGTKNDDGELIQGVNGAEVELQNEKVESILKEKETDGLGEAVFSDLPAGRYRYRVSASNHDAQTGRVWIKPGVTAAEEVFLPTSMVTVHWDVEETTIEDEYEIVLTAEYETDVPAPVVVMEPASTSIPSMEAGEVFRGEINLVNKGKIRARNVSAELPSGGDHFRFQMLGQVPDSLAAGQRVSLPYKVTCQQPLEQSGSGSGGGDCGSYMRCMTVGYEWVCANGQWSKQAVKHCWTSVYGDCSGGDAGSVSGGLPPFYHGGGGGDSASWGGGAGGGGSSSPVPEPDDLEGAECPPLPCCCSDNKSSTANDDRNVDVGCSVDTFTREFKDEAKDLQVKVPGGVVTVKREYNGKKWEFVNHGKEIGINREDKKIIQKLYRKPTIPNPCKTCPDKSGNSQGSQSSQEILIEGVDISVPGYDFGWIIKNKLFKLTDEQGKWIKYKIYVEKKDSPSQKANKYIKPVAYGNRNGKVGEFVYKDNDYTKKNIGIEDRNGNRVISYEYDDGRISAVEDAAGHRVDYFYTNGNLTKVVDNLGNVTRYKYDDKGRLIQKVDSAGRVTKVGYNSKGDVISVEDDTGKRKSFDYDSNKAEEEFYASIEYSSGKVKEIWYDMRGSITRVDVNGRTVKTIEKDGRDRIITNEKGMTKRREYNEWDQLTRVVYPDGSEVNYSYDHDLHKKTKIVDRKGNITRLEYDENGNLIKRIQAAGTDEERILTYTYNDMGKPLEATIESAHGSSSATTIFSYDDKGNLKSVTDPRGHETRFEDYDIMGNPGRIIDSRGNIWEMEYDARGRLISMTDPLGNTKSYEYDAANNLTAFVNPMLERFEFEYNAHNKMVQATDPMGNTVDIERNSDQLPVKVSRQEDVSTRSDYDNRARLQERMDGAGNRIKYHYEESTASNALSDTPVKIDYPTYSKRFYYDKMQRLVKETNVVSQDKRYSREYEYDAGGNIIKATDEQGRVWHYEYDALDRMTEVIDPTGNSTRITYDYRGNIKSITAPNNSTVHYEYDKSGNLIKLTRPQQEEITFAYDAAGNMISKTSADGRKVEYDYDALNRITRSRYYNPGDYSSPAKTVDFSYDAAGRLISYDDGATSATYSYDALGRLTGTTVDYGPFSLSYSYTYTSEGLKKSLTYPDGTTVEYSYDSGNRLTGVEIPGQGRVSIGDFTWNSPAKVTYPGGSEKQVNYDPLMRTSDITAQDPGDNAVLDRDYEYSPVGNLLSRETEQEDFSYTYDKLSRLTNSSSEKYTYDSVGNRLSCADTFGAWSYNQNNELLDKGDSSFEYDDSGRLIKRDTPAGELHYSYNAQGRISKIEDGTGKVIAEYYYDPFGRRLWKEVDGERTYFLYSQEGLIGEYKESGQAVRNYGYRPDTTWGSNPLFLKKDSAYYWYLNDRQGTPKKLISNNGKVVWSATYDSFGKAHVTTELVENNLRLAGQYYDTETGLHYNLNRYYDPDLGRYLSPDPLREGLNPYVYAQNNPLMYIDPLGLCVVKDTYDTTVEFWSDQYDTTVEFWSDQLNTPLTLQIGLGANAGGIKGFSHSGGIVIGYNPNYENVFQFGMYASSGAGLHGGATASVALDVSVSTNERIKDLEGWSTAAGVSGGAPGISPSFGFERSSSISSRDASSIYTFSAGIGVGTQFEGHGYAKYTNVW